MNSGGARNRDELRRRLTWLVHQRWWIVALFVVLQSATNMVEGRRTAPIILGAGFTLLVLNAIYAWRTRRSADRSLRALAEVQLASDLAVATVVILIDVDPDDAVGYGFLVALVVSGWVIPRRRVTVIVTAAAIAAIFACDLARVAPVDHVRWAVATAAAAIVAFVAGVLNLRRQRIDEAFRVQAEALARAQLHLAQRDRLAALGEMAAIVAHEIRNPLAVLSNVGGLLHRSSLSDKEREDLRRVFSEEIARLNATVSELLDFVRPPTASKRLVCLGPVVRTAIDKARTAAGEREVKVEVAIPDSLPPVPLDDELFTRAVVNLATNAFEAMSEGGTLRVEASSNDGAVRLTLHDTGPGIGAEALSRAFDPFFTTKATGTGLGLAIVKRIVESHRGTIAIASTTANGTTVTVELPTRTLDEETRLSL